MAFFDTDISGITTEQLAVVSALDSLFVAQSINMTVTGLDPVTVAIKANMSELMVKRLITDRVSKVLPGYDAELEDQILTVKRNEERPRKRGRKPGVRKGGTGDLAEQMAG